MKILWTIGLGIMLAILVWYIVENDQLQAENDSMRRVERGQWLTVRQAEAVYGVHVMLPAPIELQEWIIRTCPNVLDMYDEEKLTDGNVGDITGKALDEAYCWEQGIFACKKAGM